MKILAIETSAKSVSAAVTENGVPLASAYQNRGLTHSRTLMPLMDGMLRAAGLKVEEMDLLAVAAGPGSFTGLRIGVSALKGLAWALDKPCCGVSTLDAMSRNLSHVEGLVICAMDARRSQVYNALFQAKDGVLTRIAPDRALSLEELGAELSLCDAPVCLIGDGSTLTWQTLKDTVPGLILPPEHRMHQRATGVALVGERMLRSGAACDGATLLPNYLRLSQAERERLEREKAKEA